MEAISEPGPGRGQAVLRAALSVTHRHCLDNSPGVGGRISRRNGSYFEVMEPLGGAYGEVCLAILGFSARFLNAKNKTYIGLAAGFGVFLAIIL